MRMPELGTDGFFEEANMGDKSPKSKQRNDQQKNAARANDTATAKLKQDGQSRAPKIPGKGKN